MRDAAAQDRRWNERAKLWIFREIVKWWRHVPRLTATAVIRNSRHRCAKRWHVADVKNIAVDDQTTLMVHRSSVNYPVYLPLLRLFTSARSRLIPRLIAAAVATHPTHRFSKRWHVPDVKKLHWRWPGNPNGCLKFRNLGLFTFTRSQLTLQRRLRSWWWLPEIAQTARRRCQKHRRDDQDRSKFRKYENLCLQD